MTNHFYWISKQLFSHSLRNWCSFPEKYCGSVDRQSIRTWSRQAWFAPNLTVVLNTIFWSYFHNNLFVLFKHKFVAWKTDNIKWNYYTKYIYEQRHDKTNIMLCDQHGSRPACASAQSDQDPCCSLSVSLLVIGFVS
jgi:hypothetical protein